MFATFFTELKQAGVPVTLREYLTLMEAMDKNLAGRRIEEFYYLSRATLVKDERNLDRFDRVFGHVFKGLDYISDALTAEIPTEWLKKLTEKHLTEEEKKLIEALGGLDKLLETLRKRLAEQKGRHQGGKKWIGTAGTSPFGAYGYNPEGVRIGQDGNRNFRAVRTSLHAMNQAIVESRVRSVLSRTALRVIDRVPAFKRAVFSRMRSE